MTTLSDPTRRLYVANPQVLGELRATINAMWRESLAGMAAQGGLVEARELQERVVEGMRALFGDAGAETLRAINNLAGTV